MAISPVPSKRLKQPMQSRIYEALAFSAPSLTVTTPGLSEIDW